MRTFFSPIDLTYPLNPLYRNQVRISPMVQSGIREYLSLKDQNLKWKIFEILPPHPDGVELRDTTLH